MNIRVMNGATKVELTQRERNRIVEVIALTSFLAKNDVAGAKETREQLGKLLVALTPVKDQ